MRFFCVTQRSPEAEARCLARLDDALLGAHRELERQFAMHFPRCRLRLWVMREMVHRSLKGRWPYALVVQRPKNPQWELNVWRLKHLCARQLRRQHEAA